MSKRADRAAFCCRVRPSHHFGQILFTNLLNGKSISYATLAEMLESQKSQCFLGFLVIRALEANCSQFFSFVFRVIFAVCYIQHDLTDLFIRRLVGDRIRSTARSGRPDARADQHPGARASRGHGGHPRRVRGVGCGDRGVRVRLT